MLSVDSNFDDINDVLLKKWSQYFQ